MQPTTFLILRRIISKSGPNCILTNQRIKGNFSKDCRCRAEERWRSSSSCHGYLSQLLSSLSVFKVYLSLFLFRLLLLDYGVLLAHAQVWGSVNSTASVYDEQLKLFGCLMDNVQPFRLYFSFIPRAISQKDKNYLWKRTWLHSETPGVAWSCSYLDLSEAEYSISIWDKWFLWMGTEKKAFSRSTVTYLIPEDALICSRKDSTFVAVIVISVTDWLSSW